MTAGRGKAKDPRVPPDKHPDPDSLLTADDLFGDLIDSPLPASDGGAASRERPIRVQVSDPVSPAPLANASADPDLGPADHVEAAFPAVRPAGGEVRFRPAPPAPDDVEARLPPAADRTGAKLSITDAKIPKGPGVDLASVVEKAMDEPAPAPSPESLETSAPSRLPSWRDDTLGPYRLLDRLAVGGMAEVFKAKRAGVEGFEKIVAVKLILPHLGENKEFLDMFVDEAKMVAGLAHPNIVQIYELERIENTYYIAMEFVHGRDLRTILRRAREKGLRMPLDLSLRVVSQVSSALEYAHRKKDERGRPMEIVHRDVSPQNILISFEGDVKLTDFGIAKAATKASTTDRGALRGKLLYMSPEQAWGRPIDRRSDVFSLGIVLYEMITEAKPFLGGGTEMTILELVRQCLVTPPREINPRVPEALDRVIMRALARNPDERFQDAGEMQRAIEKILRERPPVTARDIARFLELLFDRQEREENGASDHRAAGEAGSPPDPMSLDAFLKRFGVE